MGEFWARNSQPDGAIFYGPHNHTIKEIASAAHVYGMPLCQAEAFTSLAAKWPRGSNWARSECPSCKRRLQTGKPAELFSSGLLGPITIQAMHLIGEGQSPIIGR